jgi:hypothetical protein
MVRVEKRGVVISAFCRIMQESERLGRAGDRRLYSVEYFGGPCRSVLSNEQMVQVSYDDVILTQGLKNPDHVRPFLLRFDNSISRLTEQIIL